MSDQVAYRHVPEIPGLVLSEALFSDFSFERHFHLDFHIGLVTLGAQRQQLNGDSFVLAPGRISLMPAGEVHDGVRAGDTPYALRTFRLSSELLQGVTEELFGSSGVPQQAGTMLDHPGLAQQLCGLHQRLQQPQTSSLLSQQGQWLILLEQLFSPAQMLERQALDGRLSALQWQRVRQYCEANLAEKISLDDLAALCLLGRFQFLRRFRYSVGMTPHAWLLRLRLEHACHLLHQRRHLLTEIAQRVGFYDQSHFNRAFRQAFGVAPSDYHR